MKKLLFTSLAIVCYFFSSAQTLTQNINNSLLQKKYLTEKIFSSSPDDFDFSQLFLHTDNSLVYGFIGDNYQRLRIKFITITKSQSLSNTYLVYGKSMVKKNICAFRGAISISSIRKYRTMSYGIDDEYKNKGIKGQYVISGSYSLNEDTTQAHSGTFKGNFQSNFYLDKNNKVHYDDIDLGSDAYINNQFVGEWISYKSKLIKRCNWGDFRVPNSGDLDMGAGEFSPYDKYLKYGWQSIRDMGSKNNDKAKQLEEAKWWK
ncbi:MAG: hypothetical protein M3N14_11720 [Bacteroidota bacterium]|nr:hypothetical protein [Bacteroidota bacterium]